MQWMYSATISNSLTVQNAAPRGQWSEHTCTHRYQRPCEIRTQKTSCAVHSYSNIHSNCRQSSGGMVPPSEDSHVRTPCMRAPSSIQAATRRTWRRAAAQGWCRRARRRAGAGEGGAHDAGAGEGGAGEGGACEGGAGEDGADEGGAGEDGAGEGGARERDAREGKQPLPTQRRHVSVGRGWAARRRLSARTRRGYSARGECTSDAVMTARPRRKWFRLTLLSCARAGAAQVLQ
jgi:hypothetical protein